MGARRPVNPVADSWAILGCRSIGWMHQCKIANITRSEHSDTLPELLYLHCGELVHNDMRVESEPDSFILLNSYPPWQSDRGTAGDGTDGYRVELFRKLREHDPWLVWSEKDWALKGNLLGWSNTPANAFGSQCH